MEENNKLVDFIERSEFKRFDRLKPDERLIAHWALYYKELLKFNFSSFYEYDLDSIELEDQMKCLSSDKKGGINWKNYMFSDQYDEKDKRVDDKGKIFAELSIYEALEKYGAVSFGDIVIPPNIMEYVKECRSNGEVPDGNIIYSLDKFKEAERICKLLAMHTSINPATIILMVGSCGTENSWSFNKKVINTYERDGKSTTGGTSGMANCGEGWFGITFWTTKLLIINGLDLNCPRSADAYASGPYLADQSEETWCRITQYWIEHLLTAKHSKLMMAKKSPTNMSDWEKLVCSCWLYKAGPAADPTMEGVKKIQSGYSNWQIKNMSDHRVHYNSFACYVFQTILLAQFLKNNKKLPEKPF